MGDRRDYWDARAEPSLRLPPPWDPKLWRPEYTKDDARRESEEALRELDRSRLPRP